MTMMPGENQSGAGAMAGSEATTGTCQNCTVLHRSLEEYVAALLKLKEKIIDTDRLLSEYKEKCDELQKSQRENSDLHKELDVVRLKVGPLEKKSADYEATKTDLVETKAALKVYQQKLEELDTLKEEKNRALAVSEKLEDALKKAEDRANTQNTENAQLRSEKKILEDDLQRTQESLRICQQSVEEVDNLKLQNAKTLILKSSLENQLLALEDMKLKQIHEIQELKSKNISLEESLSKTQKKLVTLEKEFLKEKRCSSTQTEAEPQVDKAKVQMLLQELWHCVDPMSQTSEHLQLNGPTENQHFKLRLSRPLSSPQLISTFKNPVPPQMVPNPIEGSKASLQMSKPESSMHETISPSKVQRNRRPGRKKKLSQGSEELHQSNSCSDQSFNKDCHDDKLSDGNSDLTEILDLFSPLPAALSPVHFSNKQLEDKDGNKDNLLLSSLPKSLLLNSQASGSKSDKLKNRRSTEAAVVVPCADTSPKVQVNVVSPDPDGKVLRSLMTESQNMEVEEIGEMTERMDVLPCPFASSLQTDTTLECSIINSPATASQPEEQSNQTGPSQSNIVKTLNVLGFGVTKQGLDPGHTEDDLKCTNTEDKSLEIVSTVETDVDGICSASPLNKKEPETQSLLISVQEDVRNGLESEEKYLKNRSVDQINRQSQYTMSTEINGVEPLKNGCTEDSSDEEEFFGLKRKVRGICLRSESVARVSFNTIQKSMDRDYGKTSENEDIYQDDADGQFSKSKDEDGSFKLPQNCFSATNDDESLKVSQTSPPAVNDDDEEEYGKFSQNVSPVKMHKEESLRVSIKKYPTKDLEDFVNLPQSYFVTTEDGDEILNSSKKKRLPNKNTSVNSRLEKHYDRELVNLPQNSLPIEDKYKFVDISKATKPTPDDQEDVNLSGSHSLKIQKVNGQPALNKDKDVNLTIGAPASRGALATNLSQELIGKVRTEMGPPLPPAVLPLTATPPRFGKHYTPIRQPSWSSTEGAFSLTQQSKSSPFSGQDQGKMSPSLTTPSPTCEVPSSPLQFGSATPKHAVPVPGRLPSSALNSSSPSNSQENSMQMLDTMYPELSAQARTLNILRGNLGRPGNETGPSPPSVNPISGNKTINSSSTAFTKTEQMQKRIGANVLLPKSAKRLRLDTCSPDSAACDVTLPAQQDLSSNNQEQRREADDKRNDEQSLLRDAFEKMERSCFDVLPVIKSHVFLGRISHVPALRDEEKEVISEFCSNESTGDEFLSAILTKVKAERSILKHEVLQSLCRVYIGLCRQRQDWQKAHALAYSVLKEDYPEAAKLILFMVTTWPTMLSHESVLSRAIHTVSNLKAEGEISEYLSMYLHWKENPPRDIHKLISSTLKTLLENKDLKFQKHDRYGDDLCPAAWEYIFSVDLLCTHVGWKWTHDNIVGKELWPLMNLWVTQPRNQQSPVRDFCVAVVLRLIGRLGQLGIKEKLSTSVGNVAKAINLFCKHGITEGVPWEVQLAAVYTTYDLAPSNPKDALEALASWRGETTQAVPSAIISCITQIASLCRQIKP